MEKIKAVIKTYLVSFFIPWIDAKVYMISPKKTIGPLIQKVQYEIPRKKSVVNKFMIIMTIYNFIKAKYLQ